MGSIANTHAINQSSNTSLLVRDQSGFGMSTDDSFFGTSPSVDEFLDMNAGSGHHPSVSSASDIEMDLSDPSRDDLPAFFFPEQSISAVGPSFIDPSAISGPERQSVSSRTAPVQNMGRLYPGVHTQQQAAKLREQQQQQQQQQQEQQRQATQKLSLRGGAVVPHHSTDAMVEERISRLLDSMRRSSGTDSSEGDDPNAQANGIQGQIARMRKDEEDMDEDERLLASEQGKKLSSKERRQLRNKVSARAFRSRRKGKTLKPPSLIDLIADLGRQNTLVNSKGKLLPRPTKPTVFGPITAR